eukprot:c25026_g2_i1 orf=66-938(+)
MTLLLWSSQVGGGVRAEGSLPNNNNTLLSLLQTKQRVLQSQLSSLQSQHLQARLTSFAPSPAPHLLLTALRNKDHTSVIAEVARLSPDEPPHLLAARCRNYVRLGVDAIAVRTDEEASPDGIADLMAVCNSLQVPVIRKDWFIHPLQIAETREAGAAALTLVYAILQQGLPALQSYALSLGLDPIVEIVNLKDLDAVSKLGISVYGINLSIKLSLPVPGLRQDVAKSLLQQLPDGAQSIVGIMSVEEALEMKLAGVNALYLRHEVWQGSNSGQLRDEAFLEKLRDVLANG